MGDAVSEVERGHLQTLFRHAVKHMEEKAEDSALPVARAQILRARALKDQALNGRGEPPRVQWLGWGGGAASSGRGPDFTAMQEYVKLVDSAIPDWLDDLDEVEERDVGPGADVIDALDARGLGPKTSQLHPPPPKPHLPRQQQNHGAASDKRCSKGVQVFKSNDNTMKAALNAMSAAARPGQSQSANEAAVMAALEAIEEDHAAVPAPLKGGVLPLESFPVGIPDLYEMIFDTKCQLAVHASWHARLQYSELFEEPWEELHGAVSRKLEYHCSATQSLPAHRITERQRILRDSEEDGFVVKVTLNSPELPYGAFYHVHEQYAITPHDRGCTLRVSFAMGDLGLGSVAPVVAERVEQSTRARHQALVDVIRVALDAKAKAETEVTGQTQSSKLAMEPGPSAWKQHSSSEQHHLQPRPGLQPATNTETDPNPTMAAQPPVLAVSEEVISSFPSPLDHNLWSVTEAPLNNGQGPIAKADSTSEAAVADAENMCCAVDLVHTSSEMAASHSDPHPGILLETAARSTPSNCAPAIDVAMSASDVIDVAKSAADMARDVPSRFDDFAASHRLVGTAPNQEAGSALNVADWEPLPTTSAAWHVDVRCAAEAVEAANQVLDAGQDARVTFETPVLPTEDLERSPHKLVLDFQGLGSCVTRVETSEAGAEAGGGSDEPAQEAAKGKTSGQQGSQEPPHRCREFVTKETEDEQVCASSDQSTQQHKVSACPSTQDAAPSNTAHHIADTSDEDMEDACYPDTAGRWIGAGVDETSAAPPHTSVATQSMTDLEHEVEILRKQALAEKSRHASITDAHAREVEETARLRAEVTELRCALEVQRARHAAELQELEQSNQANEKKFHSQLKQAAADLEAEYAMHTQQEIVGRETEMEKKFSSEVQRLKEVYADMLSELEVEKAVQREKQHQWGLWSQQQRETITREQEALQSSAAELKAHTARMATHKAELAAATQLVQDERRCLQEKLEQLENQTRPCLKDQQVRDVWINVRCGGGRPLPRCGHAAATCHLPQASGGSARSPQLFVFGGRDNAAARTLVDAQVFDVDRLMWSQLDSGSLIRGELSQSPPAFQGHCAVSLCSDANESLSSKVLVLGCPPKSSAHANQTLQVYVVDAGSGKWQHMAPGGSAPSARCGHSATLVSGCVWVFGGEDYDQRPVDADLYVLQLNTWQWRRAVARSFPPQTPSLPRLGASAPPPAPRAHHAAVAVGDRFLVVFGGAANNACMNDTRVFDTFTLEWLAVEPQGTPPGPRAGHAAAMLGNDWYVLGGGNNKSALHDLHVLRITTSASSQGNNANIQMRWRRVDDGAASGEDMPRAGGEGLSLVALPPRQAYPGCILAFGGYDGARSLNHLWVFTPGALMDVADALRGVLQSVKAAPNNEQQEVGAALAKCLMLTQRHPQAMELPDSFQDNLRAKAEEIDMVAREAAEQAAVYAATLVMRAPTPGEGLQATKLRAAKAALSMAVQVAGSMAAAAHIRSQTDWYHIKQQQQEAQKESNEGIQRTPEKKHVQETLCGNQQSNTESMQTNQGLWTYFSGSIL